MFRTFHGKAKTAHKFILKPLTFCVCVTHQNQKVLKLFVIEIECFWDLIKAFQLFPFDHFSMFCFTHLQAFHFPLRQCDQMARLFVNIWPLTSIKISQSHQKCAKVGLNYYTMLNEGFENSQRLLNVVKVSTFRQIQSHCP